MGMPARIVRFLYLTAWDVLLPAVVEAPVKVACNLYQCFLAADPAERLELLREARALSPAEVEQLVDALAAQWRPFLPGGALTDAQRALLRQLVAGLHAAGQPAAANDPAETLRKTLHVPPGGLPPAQLDVCRTVVRAALAARRPGGPRPLPADAPTIPGYTLKSVLGDGGFAVVYLARHDATGELRTVKVGKLDDPRRFESEVKLLRRLTGDHLVRYHEHGELPGRFWIAMEYVGEYTLADLIAARPSPGQALLLAEQVLRGLASLHAAGVVHRDLKPENAVVGDGWTVKLIDFGVAKDQAGPGKTTTMGGTAGTALYMSPEQIRGKATYPSDVWAFGCVLYELLTGRPLFAADNVMAVAIEIANREIRTDGPEVPPELRDFLGYCLQRDPDKRWLTAHKALEAFLPAAEAARKRLRRERYRPGWGVILDGRLLERFAEACGEPPADAVARFVALAGQEGVAEVDEGRVGEVLPPVLDAWRQVLDAERAVAEAKERLTRESAGLSGDELVRRAEQIRELEKVPAQRRDQVRKTVESLLAEECRAWNEPPRAAQPRPRGDEEEAARPRPRRGPRRVGAVFLVGLVVLAGALGWGGWSYWRSFQPGWQPGTMTLVAPFTPADIAAARAAWAAKKGLPERKTLTWQGVPFEFVLIPPGTFQMGSPPGDPDGNPNEIQHPVDITEPFYLLTTEVTQEMYAAVTGRNAGNVRGDQLPVELHRWADAKAFARQLEQALGERTRLRIRLPSEAEWEYACRAGTTTAYSFGDDPAKLGDHAWYGNNATGRAHPVATTRAGANPFGLHDMYGNAGEWFADAYREDYQALGRKDPLFAGADDDHHVTRGGAWDSSARTCRSADRGVYLPGNRGDGNGFRVVLVP